MMKRTLRGIVAGIAFLVALLSTSIGVFALENHNRIEIGDLNIILKEKEYNMKNNFTINGNVKIKEGLDVILENKGSLK